MSEEQSPSQPRWDGLVESLQGGEEEEEDAELDILDHRGRQVYLGRGTLSTRYAYDEGKDE